MILEGLVTTRGADGGMHLAPMGPVVDPEFRTMLLRPFPSSQTYRNLVAHGEGVFHITDDAALIARAALGKIGRMPEYKSASIVEGFVLTECCRAYEFRVQSVDTTGERVKIAADVVAKHSFREFLGFHRAKHAILEGAIQLTRLHILPRAEVEADMRRYRVIVEKTGGPAELEAMAFLERFFAEAAP
jgi:hypothetical protein